ncbi:hypothetical protein [Vitiosangium sp. GDMCC 1.1324]|uniref:hypothetical protein n=1 Tax=Vitiosangium sp. (strain GDMCC 1.1324) TaxID=2138576 RepID=UPI0018EE9850|nr:hypothetical protein [Vitiosangium sp. GDMCC 1.1324]
MTHTKSGTTTTERFDLVVGADGMRSTVRQLVFGPQEDFFYPLNQAKLRPFIVNMQLQGLKSRQLFTPANEAQRIIRGAALRLMGNRLTGPIARRILGPNKAMMLDIVAQ